ncbi:hypothetical protein EPI10_009776 [Gossypium australe]|uniref:Uncharacterized protein n=1 Tax=Gossypium australe TaxID=47621 RepID=A0A5B6U7E4_9ROSI|nr:hypothetical protein EPI10_009776 [Gossypium australe]
MEQDKEDGVLIGEEGKKRARGEMDNMIVLGDEKSRQGGIGECWKLTNLYRRLPRGKSTGRNETVKLEYSWIGESTNSKETSVYAEVTKSPNGLLYGDENL